MVNFTDILYNKNIYLYAGDMQNNRRHDKPFIGLSLNQDNEYHIKHDITSPFVLLDNTVDIFQSEDVFEHIEVDNIVNIFNEIYRVLKPGGLFRLSMPDYKCDILKERSYKNNKGDIFFDPGGGGRYDTTINKVIDGGHVWFPTYENVYNLVNQSNFDMSKVNFLHYYDEKNNPITKKIDYTNGYIVRTPDHDDRVKNPYRPMSIVVDIYK